MRAKLSRTYQCKVCRLFYTDRVYAKKCEKWCAAHNSCNLEITKHAIK